MNKGWIGVDLDGTLAIYKHFEGPEIIGEPIPSMVDRVKEWIANGQEVRIFTARVWSDPSNPFSQKDAEVARSAIQRWCKLYLGTILPITCCKDYQMVELYDDRCRQVEQNTGRLLF